MARDLVVPWALQIIGVTLSKTPQEAHPGSDVASHNIGLSPEASFGCKGEAAVSGTTKVPEYRALHEQSHVSYSKPKLQEEWCIN